MLFILICILNLTAHEACDVVYSDLYSQPESA
jgi:hypothetical protein